MGFDDKEEEKEEKGSGEKVEDGAKEALNHCLGHSWTWWQWLNRSVTQTRETNMLTGVDYQVVI